MAYSEEAQRVADQLILKLVIDIVGQIAPGKARSYCDGLIGSLSAHLETNDDPTTKEVLFILGEWSERLPAISSSLGEELENGMTISCLLDALEPRFPGICAEVHKQTIDGLQKIVDDQGHPDQKAALISAKTRQYIEQGDDYQTARVKAEKETGCHS